MKRTPLARTTRLQAKTAMKRGTKPLPKVNARQAKKRRKSYAQKLAAYRRSETYKLVERRAGGRCENLVSWRPEGSSGDPYLVCCNSGDRLQHHHLTYARFGGEELPSDVLLVCHFCHALLESLHPTRRHGRSA